jgi:hypothetical protein
MKQLILTLIACTAVLFSQAQARSPIMGQVTQSEKAQVPEQDDKEVAIYPNPSNGVFTISVANLSAKKVELRILNVIGNEIHRETLSRADGQFSRTIDLSGKAKGLYYIKLETDNYSSVRRVVIK